MFQKDKTPYLARDTSRGRGILNSNPRRGQLIVEFPITGPQLFEIH